jgi:hypothetical protein
MLLMMFGAMLFYPTLPEAGLPRYYPDPPEGYYEARPAGKYGEIESFFCGDCLIMLASICDI